MKSWRAPIGLLLLLACSTTAEAQDAELTNRVVNLLSTTCATSGCHTGPQAKRGLELDAPNVVRGTVNVPSRSVPGMRLIAPRDPEHSLLLKKVRGDEDAPGLQMPVTGDLLTQDQIQLIVDWIESFPSAWDAGGGTPAMQTARPGETPAVTSAALFFDARTVLLPTPETVGKGAWKFDIFHRFNGTIQNSDIGDLWGLDFGANMSLYFGYGLTPGLEVGLRRAGPTGHFELLGKGRLADGTVAGMPAAAALYAAWGSAHKSNPDPPTHWNAQLSLALRPFDRIALLVVPSYSTGTAVSDPANDEGTLAVGLGLEARLARDAALELETIPVLSGFAMPYASASIGLKYRYGGHTFMLLLTNGLSLHTDQYLPGSTVDPGKGLRLGFNITRRIVK